MNDEADLMADAWKFDGHDTRPPHAIETCKQLRRQRDIKTLWESAKRFSGDPESEE